MLFEFSLKKEYLVKRKKELTQSISILVKKKYFPNGQWRVDFICFSPSWVSWLCLNGDVLKKNYNFYTSKDMKYTCIIIRYNLRVRNFLTKGLGTRTYFTFQRERKSVTIMLLSSNCAELLALLLKKSITYFFNARSFYLDLVQNQPLAGQQRWNDTYMSSLKHSY